jgi:UDP-3-O-[3-hydroxymyristoyl] glucosamine N-acyltransferase
MKFPAPVTVEWMKTFINASVVGKADNLIYGINEINNVTKGDIAFVDHPKYYSKSINSAATIIIINKAVEVPTEKTLLVCEEPFEAYLKIVQHFAPFIPSTETISSKASIGKNTIIMPGSFVSPEVTIGDNCIIYPNVSILNKCTIGNNVVIQSGSIIGGEAFYYNKKNNRPIHYKRMDSCGDVILEDGVEIGANCTIDRGVTATTKLGMGTKLDNMVHVGHDVVIGSNVLIAAQSAIGGCTTIGNGVTIWGQVAINKTLQIGDGATILGKSGVGENIAPGKTYFGAPAQEAREAMKDLVWIKRVPELWNSYKK